jgi:hypothetical protein
MVKMYEEDLRPERWTKRNGKFVVRDNGEVREIDVFCTHCHGYKFSSEVLISKNSIKNKYDLLCRRCDKQWSLYDLIWYCPRCGTQNSIPLSTPLSAISCSRCSTKMISSFIRPLRIQISFGDPYYVKKINLNTIINDR